MIKKIFLTTVFLLSFQFFYSIDTETRYYNTNQTKAQVQSVLKEFETAYGNNKYSLLYLKNLSENDYTVSYTIGNEGSETSVQVHYQYFNDRITISIMDAIFTSATKTIIKLTPDHQNEKVVALYKVSKRQFVDDVFNYLKIDQNKTPGGSALDSVTKNYLSTDDLKMAKNFAKEYNDNVLTKKYTIRNIGDPESNNYDVEYRVEDVSGYAKMIVNFNFRERDFTLTLKSMIYTSKKTGIETAISSNSSVEAIANYYNTTLQLLIKLQSDYIAPDLNK